MRHDVAQQQRSRCPSALGQRRPTHDPAIEIKQTVVAGAPDLLGVLLILNGAIEASADREENAPLTGGCEDHNARPVTELEDTPAVGQPVLGET